MEYLNETPTIQIVVDYVEADDIIAYAVGHDKYRGWDKYIISSDRDFFQLLGDGVYLYRPIQKKLVDKASLMDEHGIHPNNFALARAIAGDKSDNLPGIPRAGLKTIKNRFPFMGNEEVQTVESLAEHCRNVDKPVKLHENILSGLDLIESNYDIMQLYKPVMSHVSKQQVEFALNNFEPEWNKIQFQKYLMRDGQITINLDKLFLNFKQIIS